jgi:hypothetical protein
MNRLMTPALKGIAVAVTLALSALAAVGCLLAALFEVQSFGGPRDEGPRTGYLIELGLGLVAAILVPTFIWRRLFGGGPGWILAGAIAVTGVLAILGLSLSS